jgi:protein phosphatase
VLDMMHWFLKLSLEKEEHCLDELSDCLRSIQRRLWSDSRNLDDRMGTTVTMAYVLWPRMYIVHAGDSRCYVLRNGTLRQLTTDHTFAQRLVEDGALSAEDAELSRWRHVLWNCVGGGDELVQPEVSKVDLHENDAILLCTDGLTEMCDDDEILRVLEARGSCGECVEELVRRANAAGGKDNVTAVLARFPGYLT